jgi:predicted RNA-binding protein
MCELVVYAVKGEKREKVMEGVVRIFSQDGKVLLEGIFGDSIVAEGRISKVDIMAQEAIIVVA